MIIGTRAVFSDEVGLWNAEQLQISVYSKMENNIDIMMDCIRACRESNINYVIHPVGYSLLDHEMFKTLLFIAEHTDIALLLHDEKGPDGQRLTGTYEVQFKKAVDKLRAITDLSFENATDTGDVTWFWENFADSVTLDIGHMESAGLNSVDFIRSLDQSILNKVQFVHIHRNKDLRGGITDHWPLSRDCREVNALAELLKRRSDFTVFLELNETEEIGESLNILFDLRSTMENEGSL